MSPFLISQLLAACTLATGMVAFQFKEREHILRGWCIAALFAAAHFYLLGSNEACFLVGITAIRFLISSFSTDARLMYLFMALAIGGFAVTYENPVSLLALAATLIGLSASGALCIDDRRSIVGNTQPHYLVSGSRGNRSAVLREQSDRAIASP